MPRSVLLSLFVLAFLFGIPQAAFATPFTVTPIDVVDATSTRVTSINDRGTVGGTFIDAAGVSHGFLYDGVKFTTLDFPGAFSTEVRGLNDRGLVVGQYVEFVGGLPGFIDHGFVYDGSTFKTIDAPGDLRTHVYGVNDVGTIVGCVTQGRFGTVGCSGFSYDNGAFSFFEVPGTDDFTIPLAINDGGLIVGSSALGGFAYDGLSFATFNFPGGLFTEAHGVNDAGIIVGRYNDDEGIHGFSYDGMTFTTVDVPGAFRTVVEGVNDSGVMVGEYNERRGFIATPVPEPASALLFVLALAGLRAAASRLSDRPS